MIERAVNIWRKKGINLKRLAFPSYDEVRNFEDYESTATYIALSKKINTQTSSSFQVYFMYISSLKVFIINPDSHDSRTTKKVFPSFSYLSVVLSYFQI